MASADLAFSSTQIVGSPALLSESRFQRLDSIILYGTFSFLLFGPLAFGAVEPWAVWVLSLGATLLLLLWATRQLASGHVQIASNPLFIPIVVFGSLVSVQVVFRLSAYPYATESAALVYFLYAVFCFLASQMLRRSAQVRTLAWLLTGYGFGVAVFAILQSLTGADKLYWMRRPQLGGWLYGPYVSHNHYAGLMEMLFPIALVLALNRGVHRNWIWAPAFASVLMASTIFLSGSRAGMIAFLVQMMVLGTALAGSKHRRSTWLVLAVIVVVGVLIFWVGGQALATRIGNLHPNTDADISVRWKMDRDALRMFTKRPFLGWGLATFPIVYPQFRTFYTDKFTNNAHNDQLQLMVETGLLGFGTALWFVFSLYRAALRKLKAWESDLNGSVTLAAIVGCTGILVHSFLDSNLQIPANAALFYSLATIAAANTNFGSHRRIRHHHRGSSQLQIPDCG